MGLSISLGSVSALQCGLNTAAAVYSQADTRKYFQDSEAAWVAAEVTGNTRTATHILAEDHFGVLLDATIGRKADAVASFKPTSASSSGRLENVHVRVFANVADTQSQETGPGRRRAPIPRPPELHGHLDSALRPIADLQLGRSIPVACEMVVDPSASDPDPDRFAPVSGAA